jgi:twinkle protein
VGDFIKHTACPKCGSSDALAVYSDNLHCFSCDYHVNGDYTDMMSEINIPTLEYTDHPEAKYNAIPNRGISSATARFYRCISDDKQHTYAYTSADGKIIAAKHRDVQHKQFRTSGDIKNAVLYGQALFSSGGRYVTITEGEIDAMAAYQMLGSKYPVVSIKSGAQAALKDCKANYEWLNSFENIVISFDSDAPGKSAAKDVAELFGSKCKIVTLTKHKDAGAYLATGDGKTYIEQWWAAGRYVPDGIISGSELWDLVNKPVDKAQVMYPWDGLNDLTYGIRQGELVTVTAGSGLGKSLFLREVVYHILKNTEDNIGLLFMEESVYKTARSIMSMAINKPLHLPDTEVTSGEMLEAFNSTLGTDRLYLFDHFGSMGIDNVINRIKYMAKALDCRYVVLDHISILVSDQQNGDERKYLDEVMTKLRVLVQETGVALLCVSHLKRPDGKGHEEGAATSLAQLRGSASIAQLSDMVIGLERHAQAADEAERNTTHVRILKNRLSGMTGECCHLLYDKATGRMSEVREIL